MKFWTLCITTGLPHRFRGFNCLTVGFRLQITDNFTHNYDHIPPWEPFKVQIFLSVWIDLQVSCIKLQNISKDKTYFITHKLWHTISTSGAQIFQKSRIHLKILGTRTTTQSKLHTEHPQTLGAAIQNLVTGASYILSTHKHQVPPYKI
jgi:hypothetical protein